MPLKFHEYQSSITSETAALCGLLESADLRAQVPSCPDWSLEELAVHVGQAHRWADRIVRTRATGEVADEEVPAFTPPVGGVRELTQWLTEGAALLVQALQEAGEDARVWSWFTDPTAGFWARRMTHETVVHRADACLAAEVPFTTAPSVAADSIDEWLTLVCSPATWEEDEEVRELARWAGASLRLVATDTAEEVGGQWLIELGPDGVRWQRGGREEADVVLSGPLDEVLRVFYRRLPPHSELVEVRGDMKLLEVWLERVSFGG
ncbi:maleylpyruvate isomerase family mycothiol-dependent enzyme [Streptomyces sp. XM4193]|uniref:maleylpyruvate isomerase family mycothiol-dependent enzyme n=1 Tax=Streptomyces sp. XM4193 TaxID=2929782 RepID=UPI001FF8A883|nr:maleylpyruvate isomerase family mycothiol-dependent enzyme [Streptomyces sp. XM4193]MCK1798102.1 maleylpyruvate isomerase family mycothiol-dependent enzyme [Streptomyces sp. XM4193]